MTYTVQLERLYFEHNEKDGTDGAAIYLILSPCEQCKVQEGHHICAAHVGMTHHYEIQRFRKGPSGHRRNATPEDIAENRANVWGWDGNIEAPTLRASFLGAEKDKNGRVVRPYRLHCFITGGKIELCGDSTVILETNPVHCWDRED